MSQNHNSKYEILSAILFTFCCLLLASRFVNIERNNRIYERFNEIEIQNIDLKERNQLLRDIINQEGLNNEEKFKEIKTIK